MRKLSAMPDISSLWTAAGSAKTRPIRLRFDLLRPPRGVVHLEDDLRSGRDALGHAVGQDAGRQAGCVGGEEVAAGLVDLLDAGRQDEDDGVVDDRWVPRPDLRGADPDVVR